MPEIVRLLSQLMSGDDSLAEKAVQEISKQGLKPIDPLIELLDDENADFRWWAIRALAEIGSEKTDSLIIKHLKDNDLAVQQCAAIALRIKPLENSIKDLIPLLDHNDQLLSHLASDALIANGDKSTLPLIKVLENGSQKAQIQAVRALAMIGDTRSISALFSLLDNDSAMLDYWANEGLIKMGIGMTFFNPG